MPTRADIFDWYWAKRSTLRRHRLLVNGLVVVGLAAMAASVFFADVIPPRSMTNLHMLSIRQSILAFRATRHCLPTSLDGLPPEGDRPCPTTDGWGRPITLRIDPGGLMSLVSFGRDGRPGGVGNDADPIATFDPRQPAGADWIRDPFGRPPTSKPYRGLFDSGKPHSRSVAPDPIRPFRVSPTTRP